MAEDHQSISFASSPEGLKYYVAKLAGNPLSFLVDFNDNFHPILPEFQNPYFTDGPHAGQLNPAIQNPAILDNLIREVARIQASNDIDGWLNPHYLHGLVIGSVSAEDLDRFNELFVGTDAANYLRVTGDLGPHGDVHFEAFDGGEVLGAVCTGGFPGYIGSVQGAADNISGIVTAKHCFDGSVGSVPTTYDGYAIASLIALMSGEDIAFAAINGLTTQLTRVGSQYQAMYEVRSPVVGQTLCHYGAASGMSCSTVYAVLNSWTSGTKVFQQIVVMQADVSDTRDSGGPWFTNNIQKHAVGVHLGEIEYDGVLRSVFTRISAVSTMFAHLYLAGML